MEQLPHLKLMKVIRKNEKPGEEMFMLFGSKHKAMTLCDWVKYAEKKEIKHIVAFDWKKVFTLSKGTVFKKKKN